MKQYKSHGYSPFVGHGDCVGHGDGPFASVPLFVLLTVGNQGDRYKRTVPLFPQKDRPFVSLCFLCFCLCFCGAHCCGVVILSQGCMVERQSDPPQGEPAVRQVVGRTRR